MKRSWTTIVLSVGLIGLLAALGVMQYRWLSQISESDGEKARVRVKEQAERFAMDFNREIQNAYFNFQTGSESWRRNDWAPFNERYDFWREKTTYPELITDFYFFEAKGDSAPLRYDRTGRTFLSAESTPELSELRSRFSDDKSFRAVYEDQFSLVLPIHEHEPVKTGGVIIRSRTPDGPPKMEMPEKYGYLVIRLDSATINDKILPDLTAKYFGDGEYRAAVTGAGGEQVFQSIRSGQADATAPLFDLSPDNFIFYGTKDIMAKVAGEKHEGPTINSRVENRTFNRVETKSEKQSSVKIELKQEGIPRTSVFTATTRGGGPWTLHLQHSSGSLGTHLASTLRRNLTLGFGVLFLLAAAIAAIVFSAQRVRRLAQRQVDFVSSVSHEFRTPLAVIYSAGENLADGVAKEDGQVARYGNLIKGEGRKLTGMVEQILDFAGAKSGKRKFNFSTVSVGAIVDAAIIETRPLIDGTDFEIETAVADGLPPINADAAALSQAVQNLIANSIKYSNGHFWLRVSASNGDGRVQIAVEDRGIGIPKRDLRHVFEPFFRSREVVDAQIHGNGLGLSLVKQIVEAHGGKVRAESEIGKGSKFTIDLRADPPS